MYASQMLSIMPKAFAKLSVVWLVRRISENPSMRKTCLVDSICLLVWAAFSLFSIVFQCGKVQPWVYAPQKCAGDLWYVVVVLNIVTDAILAFFFAPTLWKLQTSRSQRIKVIMLFAIRIVAVEKRDFDSSDATDEG